MFNKYSYTEESINRIVDGISPERLKPYLSTTNSDYQKALELYSWNTHVSLSLFAAIQGLEIVLRNCFHNRLSKKYGASWYGSTASFFKPKEQDKIVEVLERLENHSKYQNRPIPHGKVIAELHFGFWVSLTKGEYASKLYGSTLRHGLYNKKLAPKKFHSLLNYIRLLRNRIAHHEPVFNRRNLEGDYKAILEAISHICPHVCSWVEHHNDFYRVYEQKLSY